jgi:hypothetical protein
LSQTAVPVVAGSCHQKLSRTAVPVVAGSCHRLMP